MREVQEPHPQPPPRKQGGGYNVPYLIGKRYIEVLTLEVANNPWTDFIGMFEGDEEFADLAQELRTERELHRNSTVSITQG